MCATGLLVSALCVFCLLWLQNLSRCSSSCLPKDIIASEEILCSSKHSLINQLSWNCITEEVGWDNMGPCQLSYQQFTGQKSFSDMFLLPYWDMLFFQFNHPPCAVASLLVRIEHNLEKGSDQDIRGSVGIMEKYEKVSLRVATFHRTWILPLCEWVYIDKECCSVGYECCKDRNGVSKPK